jgi:ABC-type branched-subunit amino acid transport system substrate-binding protein
MASLAAACSSNEDERGSGGTATETELIEAAGPVRGFDGTTIRLASIGFKTQLPNVPVGVEARIKRFNDGEEIDGIRLEYVEYADDGLDPASALTEARRLVDAEDVFAVVGDVSANNPTDYWANEHVPYFGWAVDAHAYCSADDEVDPTIWGFGYVGCGVPENAESRPQRVAPFREWVTAETGEEQPTLALFSGDNDTGKTTLGNWASEFAAAGFDVVYHEGNIPAPPVADYTPYVQELIAADGGEPPDTIFCIQVAACVPIFAQLQALDYPGIFTHPLYSDQLAAPMVGSVALLQYMPLNEDTDGVAQLKADVAALDPAATIDNAATVGYMSTDMFIQAFKTVAAQGDAFITPENVRTAAMNQTWEIPGLAGPTAYPASTVLPTPGCAAFVRSTGAAWETIVPYDCSEDRVPVLDEFAG